MQAVYSTRGWAISAQDGVPRESTGEDLEMRVRTVQTGGDCQQEETADDMNE